MDAKEMASEEVTKAREQINEDALNARRTDWDKEQMKQKGGGKGLFKCGKCGSQNTTYYQMQTRSADEPMTNFVTCLDCNKKWRC